MACLAAWLCQSTFCLILFPLIVVYDLFVSLGHGVQSATVLEPLNLAGVEGVGQLDLEGLAILGLDDHGDGLAGGELGGLDVDLLLPSLASLC